jgi:hypothetical protein
VFAPRQDLGDGNLVPRESSLAAAESSGLSPTNAFFAEAVDGQASNQFHPSIVQHSASSTFTPTSAISAPEVRAFASYASIVQSSVPSAEHVTSAGHVPFAHHISASSAEHIASATLVPLASADNASITSGIPGHPASVTRHYESSPDDSLVPILSTASPIIQGLSSQLARIQAEYDQAICSRVALDPSVAMMAADESNEGYAEALSVLKAAAASEKKIKALSAQVLLAQRQLSEATQVEHERQQSKNKRPTSSSQQVLPTVGHLSSRAAASRPGQSAPSTHPPSANLSPHTVVHRPTASGGYGATGGSRTTHEILTEPALQQHLLQHHAKGRVPPLDGRPAASKQTSRMPTVASESHDLAHYDSEERRAIRTGDTVGAEDRSQDSQTPSQLQLDRNGYSRRDKFVASDHESLEFTDEDPSTDDDSCTEASGDEDDQPDPREERQRRRHIVQDAIARMKAKATEAGTAIFPYSISLDELTTHRATPIRVKRRIVNRTVLVDVMLNTWLNGNLEKLDADLVSEFLRLLKLHALDRAKSIYFRLAKRIRPISFALFKFLYRCIVLYLPSHKSTFASAYHDVLLKEGKIKASEASDGVVKPVTHAPITMPNRPTLKPPSVANISDMAGVVGKFYNEYRGYYREQISCRVTPRTMFQCLDADQASSFAAIVQVAEDDLDCMSAEDLLEIWRTHFGLRSSAAVLQALQALQFDGNSLTAAVWADWHRKFKLVVAQAPVHHLPPTKVLAKRFIQQCPDTFLRNDVLANEPETVEDALRMVMQRLHDSGFLTTALEHSRRERFRGARDSQHPAHHQAPQQAPLPAQGPRQHPQSGPQGPPPPGQHPRRDGSGGGAGGAGGAVRTHTQDPAHQPKQQAQRVHINPRAPAPAITCHRCRKEGHSEKSCISRHDADGNRLPQQEPEIYAKRKEQARLDALARAPKVHAVCQESSGTEDVEGDLIDAEYNDAASHFSAPAEYADYPGCYSITGIVDHTPAPRLVGVHTNPGPDVADYAPAPRLVGVHTNPGPDSIGRVPVSRLITRVLPVQDNNAHVPAPPLIGIEPNPGPKALPHPYVTYSQRRRLCRNEYLAHAITSDTVHDFSDPQQSDANTNGSLLLLFVCFSLLTRNGT